MILSICIALASMNLADFPLPPDRVDTIYVSSYGTHEIYCYRPDGTYSFKFDHENLQGPRGLSFSAGGELYAAAQSTDRILVFSKDGTYLREFTGGGLDGPTGVTVGPDGRLYVSSFNTDEVLIFSIQDEFVASITHEDLNGPNCVAFRPDRMGLYVVSQLTSSVFQFDENLNYVRQFTGGGLSSAMGAAIYEDQLFVTGGSSNNVAVFDFEGNFLFNIEDKLISQPQGIAFDNEGNFVVSSFRTIGKITYFTRTGELLDVFDDVGVTVGRSIAFLLVTEEADFIRGDINRDDKLNISDAQSILGYLFLGLQRRCPDAGDTNDDGALNIADASYVLNFLFSGGSKPKPPYPEKGLDPTADNLFCLE